MGLTKTTTAAYLLAFSALSGAEVTTTSAGTGTPTKAIHSITTTTTTTSSRTITHTSATSPAGKSSTTSSHVPGVTHIPDTSIFLSIVPARSSHDPLDNFESIPIFINATLPTLQTPSCDNASPFNLTSGRLSHHGKYLSTIADVVYQPLTTTSFAHVNPREGAREIDTGFSVEDGFLRWYDSAFYGGRARYCRIKGKEEGGMGMGVVNAVFHISKTWPKGCEEVDVRVYRTSECRDGKVVEGTRIGEGEGGEARTTGVASATTGAAGWDEL
ncbi:hypothetical protein F4806DRAFT_507888 [Annulohypoxylon nitens]|nr:hypothetical protein F4806DRAFT_507888 [Annulohypoxylon nitens]